MEVYTEEEARRQAANPVLTGNLAVAKVYLWFAFGIFLSGAMALGYPYLITAIYGSANDAAFGAYVTSLIVFTVLMLPLGVACNISSLTRHSAWITIFYILYAICVGGAFSSISLFLNMNALLYAFLVTAGTFLLMGLIGVWTNGRIGKALTYLIGIVFGLIIISLFNILVFGAYANSGVYWITSILIFAIYLILAAVDTNRVIQTANGHGFDDNNTLVIYAAFSLYSDFVIIFYYIVRLMIILGIGSNKN